MTEKFRLAYEATMRHEGGYANDPNDHGGETWRGIARNSWSNWPGWKIVDDIKLRKPTSLNAALQKNASLDTLVLNFYKQNFWDPLNIDLIHSNQISLQLFDMSVNSGISRGAKILQEAINRLIAPNQIAVDGDVGNETITAANGLDHQALYNQINVLRSAFYERIIKKDPTQERFRRSWFSRIHSFKAENDMSVA
ncbi:MAG: glycosyl hydrolase 108 family protein [Pedobacter sp.]